MWGVAGEVEHLLLQRIAADHQNWLADHQYLALALAATAAASTSPTAVE